MTSFILTLIIVSSLQPFLEAYRLNVPRVLLPYHPNVQVKYQLVVSDPEGGCFFWRSTRPDIVSVKVLEPKGSSGCSDRAEIASTSKHDDEQIAVIFAEDLDAHVILSCGVSVDTIRRIQLSTTTKVLFLDAAPAKMVVHALNSEGDMFSSVGEIPFEWRINSMASAERPLRIVPFSQSKYEAPDGIRELEENKKRGNVVLVEGVSTGAANLQASLVEPFFKNVDAVEIDLVVVANLVLIPSADLYIPLGSIVHYSAEIIKQSSHQPIVLPSRQYKLVVSDESICSLNIEKSLVTAHNLGSTQISIIDENLKANHKPVSSHIYVVPPSGVSFVISTGSWYLQKGSLYGISVSLLDSDDNVMLIPENARFETTVPEEYFEILEHSSNNTYFYVKAIKSGMATIRSTFLSVIDEDGHGISGLGEVNGEKMATISDAVEIWPKSIIFAYDSELSEQQSWNVEASGGTGIYVWSSGNARIVDVDQYGVVSARDAGETSIMVRDGNNALNYDTAIARVLPPVRIDFMRSKHEAEIGDTLELSVGLFVKRKGELLPVTDCRHVKLSYSVDDSAVFELVDDYEPKVALNGDGCSSVQLRALSNGDTRLVVRLNEMTADVQISSYPSLKLESPSAIMLSLGSEVEIRTSGGPRPWVVDPSGYFSKLGYSESVDLVSYRSEQSNHNAKKHFIACQNSKGDMLVTVNVGNDARDSNPLPARASAELRICCAVPKRLSLAITREHIANLSTTCPTNSNILLKSKPSKLTLSAYGKCESGSMWSSSERRFDSISALLVEYSTDEPKLLTVEKLSDSDSIEGGDGEMLALARPQQRVGASEIVAKAEKYLLLNKRETKLPSKLWAALDTNIVDEAYAVPSEVVLWNDRNTIKNVTLHSGSQQFHIETIFDDSVVSVKHRNGNILQIKPQSVGTTQLVVVDACFGSRIHIAITVTDLHEIAIEAPNFVALNEEIPLRLYIRDANGTVFSVDDVTTMQINLEMSSQASDLISVIREDALNYRIRGVTIGTVTLSATVRSASQHQLRSVEHEMQVFAPLRLLPEMITLVPESQFQLEVIGGPQPLPPLAFTLNDSSVATVFENGLISSEKKLGTTTVQGTISMGETILSKASVVVRVVSLQGIRIRLSSNRLEQGTLAWARIDGLADDETPFAFGGAKYPLRVKWTLGTHTVLQIISAFQTSTAIRTSVQNQFEVLLSAREPGQVQLRVSVEIEPNAKLHFYRGARLYEDRATVVVVEGTQLLQPAIQPRSIRITPNAQIQLKPNRADGTFALRVPQQFASQLTIGGDSNAVLKAFSIGDAVVELQHISIPHNESTFIPISVVPLHSVHLESETAIPFGDNGQYGSGLSILNGQLPLGFRLALAVSFRDHAGRLFHATNARIKFRPHRFDKTTITLDEDKQLLNVYLKRTGETVLKVWDELNPAVSTYLRVAVDDMIEPKASTTYLVGDLVCFKSLIACGAWRESSSSTQMRHFNFIDSDRGIASANQQGNAVISAHVDVDQSIFTEATITSADQIQFGEIPKVISNIPNRRFIFSVHIGNNSDVPNVHGCDSLDLKKLDGLHAPFECMVTFEGNDAAISASSILMANAVFVSSIGSYSCVVEEGFFGKSSTLIENDQLNVLISAKWITSSKVMEANARTVFYARFEVDQQRIHLNNVHSQKALLTISAPKSILKSITFEACQQGILLIGKPNYASATSVQYQIKLNVNSATLWREFLKECNITVTNKMIGQTETISVQITLHGDASKAIINASESLLDYLAGLAEYSMMIIGTVVVTLLLIAVIIAHRSGIQLFPYLFGNTFAAQSSSSGVFASDRSPHTPGYAAWRSMTNHLVRPGGNTSSLSSTSFTDASRMQTPQLFSTSPTRASPSTRFSGSMRSAKDTSQGGAGGGETFLWSTGDSLNTPSAIRDMQR